MRSTAGLLLAFLLSVPAAQAAYEPVAGAPIVNFKSPGDRTPPVEWIDPATGHRVIRLSVQPGSASLYFHQYPFSADGTRMVMTTPTGLSTVDLRTRVVRPIVSGRVYVLVVGRKTGDVYYVRPGEGRETVYATNLDTGATRLVAKLPPGLGRGNLTVNADETLLVGLANDPEGKAEPRAIPPGAGGGRLARRWAEGLPMMLYTIDIRTGAFRKVLTSHWWLNHLQCSPTDPGQIMFCHEGPWQFNNRIWTVRTDGSDLRMMQPRTMDMEIAGHEFFSHDGRSVWYDLQTPESGVFWVAGVDLETGRRTWYHLKRDEWSVHYNISPDGKLFAGDGGGPDSVANRLPDGERMNPPGNGQWIYLFRPVLVHYEPPPALKNEPDLIHVGFFKAERLVNLANHNYRLEPNVHFTPDGKWIVFRSNRFGPTHVFEVQIAKAK
jgi:Oligogalacturonate lyase/WD40-like Beta Propeller Repeat